MKFFNIDLHISVIEDISKILSDLGHSVESRNLSNSNWVFEKSSSAIDIINQGSWEGLDENMCDRFYERYKDELSDYDAFICAFPVSFCLLYEKFNKPIYCVAATRYEIPFYDFCEKWSWFNTKLVRMIDDGQVVPIANNKYDKFYCEYFTQREWLHIPNICDYTNAKYSPSQNEHIVVDTRFHPDFTNCQGTGLHLKNLGRHDWQQYYNYLSIIHVPYNVSLMSIFEQYTANVPLFFPTIEFGKYLGNIPEYHSSETAFMSQLLFSQTFDEKKAEHLSTHKALLLSDFYDEEWMPFINFYDSTDLGSVISSVNLEDVSKNMRHFNQQRKDRIYNLWRKIIL